MSFIIVNRVKETSVSTGTGDFTLDGAMSGFQSFASQCSVGDNFHYLIQSVNATSQPNGEWESGIGTYSATNTLTRTVVISSSNANAVVNFSAGTKQVWINLEASDYKEVRQALQRGTVNAAINVETFL